MIYPWLEPLWARWVEMGERVPHALLLSGAAGLGKRDLAEAMAARQLCESPQADGQACGHCSPCQWRISGNHPDLRRLVPEIKEESGGGDEAGEADSESSSGESKAKPTQGAPQILISQIRAVQEALTLTAHHRNRRAVIVDPAEAMNPVTANALLKLLEEPPEGCVFLLVSSAPRRLLPTIRSRCQQWAVPRPDAEAVRRWQAAQNGANRVPDNLLAFCGGLPLAAHRLAEQGGGTLFERFTGDLCAERFDPLRLAAQWESWLKKDKTCAAAKFGLVTLVEWMQRWVSDLAAMRLGGRVRYFPAQSKRLAVLSSKLSKAAAAGITVQFTQFRRVAAHPLNLRLFLENMLITYENALKGSAP
ncbi:MAG: DNA polymerase III subunit delta' [Azoarcus sp.]|nr:DNA polymerase III subunit delta' [Azoarcus sp.]